MLAGLTLSAAVLAGAALYVRTNDIAVDTLMVSSIPQRKSKAPLASLSASARAMPVCGRQRRINCVVDGDTFWLEGEKYRIANIDTPELKGKCKAEQAMALRARQRLAEMVNDRPIQIEASGKDRYGRRLVMITDVSGDLGQRLVAEGLAEVWGGAFIDWCGG